MQTEPYPTERTIALHLFGGVWIASCGACGHELASGHDQAIVEGWAALTACQVCQDDASNG
jgi:hypothetical protein